MKSLVSFMLIILLINVVIVINLRKRDLKITKLENENDKLTLLNFKLSAELQNPVSDESTLGLEDSKEILCPYCKKELDLSNCIDSVQGLYECECGTVTDKKGNDFTRVYYE